MRPGRPAKVRSRNKIQRIGKVKALNAQAGRRHAAQALLVLGMHRSGTSALTRVLNLLGADLPKNLDNQLPNIKEGHWESSDLIAIHDGLLATAGSRWDDWRAFNPNWLQSGIAEDYGEKLLSVLQNDFDGSALFVVKEPRICRFVPLWLDVLKRFGADAYIIIPLRNPLEVAASLKRRDNFSPAKSCLLWLRHVLDAEKATRGMPRAIVTYSDLLDDWRSVVTTVAAKTGLHWPRRSDRSEFEIDQFLADTLRHHATDETQLSARADIVDWVKEAYRLVRQMADGRETKDLFKRLDHIHSEFDKGCATFGLVLLGEAEQSESRLRSIETQIKIRNEEFVQLSGELTQARSAASEAQMAVAAGHSRAASLTADIENARATAQDRDIVIADNEGKIAELCGQLTTIKTASEDLRREREQLAAALEEERAAATRNVAQAALLGQELGRLRAVVEGHESAATTLRADLDNIQSVSNDRKNEIDKLSRELKSGQSAIRDRDRDVDRLSHEIEATRRALRDSQSETQRLAGEHDTARLTNDRMKTQINDLSDELQSATAQASRVRDLEARLHQIREEKDMLTDDLTRTIAEVRSVERHAADRIDALQTSNAASESKAQVQIGFLRNQLVDAEAALAKSRKELNGHTWMRALSKSRRAKRQLMKSGLFDAEWYLREYPYVAESSLSPVEHYLEEGYLRGCRPNPFFDTRWYLERYEDVRRSGVNPLLHYLMHGFREGRDPGPDFQTDYYLIGNPDVRSNGMNPLAHYLRHGRHEGRLPMRRA